MILNETQVKLIADRGRALPDAVLAPLVLAVVLEHAAPPHTIVVPAVLNVSQSDAQPARTPGARSAAKRGLNTKSQERIDAVVAHLTAHPGAQMHEIAAAIGAPRNVTREAVVRAIQDDRAERRGTGNDTRYYVAGDGPKPVVLLAEQRIDGENKQTLVRVERRRGVARRTPPQNAKQRAYALVEYVRTHPGATRSDFLRDLGWGLGHLQHALKVAKASGELRMDGEKRGAQYFVRSAINGAVNGVAPQ